MRIAIVTTEFISEKRFDGGLANYTYKLAKMLIERGHFVIVYITSSEQQIFKYDNINVVKVKIPDLVWHINYYLKKIGLNSFFYKTLQFKIEARQTSYFLNRFLKREVVSNKIDVIHYPNLASLTLFRLKGVPTVVRLSSSAINCQLYGGYGEDLLKSKIMCDLEYKALKKADVIFGPSLIIAKETEKLIDKKVNVIETPFLKDTKEWNYTIFNDVLKDKKYILFYGSIGLIKGVGTIAEIIYEFLNAHTDYYYVFVGKKLQNEINGKNVWDYLIEKSAEHKNRIIHFDPIKHEQLFPIILNADIITLPSRIDNFPNTCIESMALGKVVIGTNGNGFEQLIEHEKSGYLISVDDHIGLLSTISKIITLSEGVKNEIEKNAEARIALLAPHHIMPQIEDLYESVINQKKQKEIN